MTRELVIVGDEAWLKEDWEAELARLERKRKPRSTSTPAVGKRRAQYRAAKYRAKLRDERPEPVGYLHALSCAGPANHRLKPSCRPIAVYSSKP